MAWSLLHLVETGADELSDADLVPARGAAYFGFVAATPGVRRSGVSQACRHRKRLSVADGLHCIRSPVEVCPYAQCCEQYAPG
jgi:hypothetical protein